MLELHIPVIQWIMQGTEQLDYKRARCNRALKAINLFRGVHQHQLRLQWNFIYRFFYRYTPGRHTRHAYLLQTGVVPLLGQQFSISRLNSGS